GGPDGEQADEDGRDASERPRPGVGPRRHRLLDLPPPRLKAAGAGVDKRREMAPAAPATNHGHGESSSGGRRRRAARTVSRRALLQLLIGVLVVGVIPVVATV